VAESSAGLAAALAEAGNRDFTLIVYPDASHAIGKTQTGELGEQWTGYVPEYLEDMTDWVLQQAGGVRRAEGWPRGRVVVSDQPVAAGHDDRFRWYGTAPVQAAHFLVFAVVFLVGAVAGTVGLVRGRRNAAPKATRPGRWLAPVATAVSLLNLALLAGLVALARGLADPWEPRYPGVFNWLPLAGSLSVCLTLALLALLIARGRSPADSRRKRTAWVLFGTCAAAFVPFLWYWNLLGLALR
jgi:hypothetical protein